MADDLTRDDLARLKSLRDEAVGAAAGGAYADAILDCADALLAAAERDLDRREGLVFGPWLDGANHVVAVDGCRYTVWAMDGQYRVFVYASMHGKLVGSFATEAEAIEQARAHDVARRGGK